MPVTVRKIGLMIALLPDEVRRCRAHKRGGLFHLTSLDTHVDAVADRQTLVQISGALDELAMVEPSA